MQVRLFRLITQYHAVVNGVCLRIIASFENCLMHPLSCTAILGPGSDAKIERFGSLTTRKKWVRSDTYPRLVRTFEPLRLCVRFLFSLRLCRLA